MRELVKRTKVYSVVDPSFVSDRKFSELAKLYGKPDLARKQLKTLEASDFYIGSVFVSVWGDERGADEVGFEFVFKGERKGVFQTDMIQTLLEDVIDDVVAGAEEQGIETTRFECRLAVFDMSGQFVPIEPGDDFYAADDDVVDLELEEVE